MQTQTVTYAHAGKTLQGQLALPDKHTGKCPGIVVFHDVRGVALYPHAHVAALLRQGYVVLAADMYGNGINPEFEKGQILIKELKNSPAVWQQRAHAAANALMRHDAVDPQKIAAVGYCFGGSTALQLALSGVALRAAISIHGGLDNLSLHDAAALQTPILVCTGAEDPVIPAESVLAFQNALRHANVADWQVMTFSGAKHSYSNPDAPISPVTEYNARADRRTLAAMLAFLSEVFQVQS